MLESHCQVYFSLSDFGDSCASRSKFTDNALHVCRSALFDLHASDALGSLKSPGEARGALPYKRKRDVPFFRVSFFSVNS